MTKAVLGIIGGSGIYDLAASRNLYRYANIGAALVVCEQDFIEPFAGAIYRVLQEAVPNFAGDARSIGKQ
jgi:purine nucleoside phosphorylase